MLIKYLLDMIIVSDGVVGNTDVHVLDSVIQQLRATTIACSFLHVGSTYHPHCADGLVPYQELLHFIARATLGTYMSFRPYPVRNILSIHLNNKDSTINLFTSRNKNYYTD